MLTVVTTPQYRQPAVADGPSSRQFALATAVGLIGGICIVLCTAPLQAEGARKLLGPWDFWARRWAPWQREPATFTRGGLIVVAAILPLVVAWLLIARLAARVPLATSRLVLVSACWSIPFALAPPILSRDAYAYLAQGAVAGAGAGGSPYRSPQLALHATSQLLHAMDPLYRNRLSPYGPLAVRLFQGCLALATGNGVLALLLFRGLVLACVWFTVWCGWRLAPPHRRSLTVWLIAANPLILMDLVGGLHLDALIVALLAAAFVCRRKYAALAAALVVAAAAVKVTAVIALAAVFVDTFRLRGWRGLMADVAGAAAALAALVLLLQPKPFGWIPALASPLQVWDPISSPTATALLWATMTGGSPLPLVALLRPTFLVAGLTAAALVLFRASSLSPLATTGYLFAAATVSGPVLWPWYLVPAVVFLVLGGSRVQTALAIAMSVGAAVTNLPMPVVQMQRVSAVGCLCVGGGLLLRYCWGRRTASPRPSAPTFATPGPSASA